MQYVHPPSIPSEKEMLMIKKVCVTLFTYLRFKMILIRLTIYSVVSLLFANVHLKRAYVLLYITI